MALSNITYSPGESMQSAFDKINAAIDDLNDNQLKWTVINIGDWNMDTTDRVYFNLTSYGLDKNKIRVVSAMIRSDADANPTILQSSPFPIDQGIQISSGASGIPFDIWIPAGGCGIFDFTAVPNELQLFRFPGALGLFDNSDFDATSYNRGWITIGHVE